MGRIDAHAAATATELTREDFLQFITLTEDELDEVCDTLGSVTAS